MAVRAGRIEWLREQGGLSGCENREDCLAVAVGWVDRVAVRTGRIVWLLELAGWIEWL